MKLVSVIICIYNGEQYVKQCLDSVFEQAYKDIEIIVVDDGSIDNTRGLVQEYSDIKYIYQENRGLAAARNTALSYVSGEYVAMLDVDDLYTQDKIEKQVKYLEENTDIDIVYNDAILIDKDGQEIKILKPEYSGLNKEDFLACILFRQSIHCTASIMVRRKCFDNVKFPEGLRQSEDYYVTIELAKKYRFGYLEESLYKYRRHEKNLTNNRAEQEKNEINVIKNIGVSAIQQYVAKSSFSDREKTVLLAKILFKIEKYEETIRVLSEKALEGIGWQEYFYLGNAYYMLGAYDKAEKSYKKALLKEQKAELYNNLGVIYYCENKRGEATKFFELASNMRIEYLDPRNNLKAIIGKQEVTITYRELRENLMRY